MDVSIILVNYNTRDLTLASIKSIIEQTNNLEYEIFVVDNASQDGSVEAIKETFNQVKIISNNENLGFGRANNLAIKEATGKYIFCLNTDTLLINNAIKILFDYMETSVNQNVACCGGNLYDKAGNHIFSHGIFLTPFTKWAKTFGGRYFCPKIKKILSQDTTNSQDENKSVDFVCGADLMIRKSILDELGVFDKKFFLYYEEVELQKRIKDAGYDIHIVPEAKIIHLESASSKNSTKKKALFLKSEYIFLRDCYCESFLEKLTLRFTYLITLLPKLSFKNKDILKLFKYILSERENA